MRFKLDENLHAGVSNLLTARGHDVDTVPDEGLQGHEDSSIYDACREAHRTLVTLDLDFANPLRFPPAPTEGIIILRLPRPLLSVLLATLASMLPELESREARGSLWIVEPGRLRIHDSGHND